MKRRSILFLSALTLMVLSTSGCSNITMAGKALSIIKNVSTASSKGDSGSKGKKSSNDAKSTMMVYMVGSDLESEIGAATNDLQEMALSGYDQDDMNLVICAGGANSWWNSSVDDDLKLYIMEDEDIVPVDDMNGQNMADPDTLTE
ncbi:MAG: hypothetical protein K5894_09330, partial [Lachnospiraceae bacterium]|nr:hypothetical protein [Lachnospiraceae bacterium]